MLNPMVDKKTLRATITGGAPAGEIDNAEVAMDNIPNGEQYGGPTTTANSMKEGRMKVDASGMKKNKKNVLKKILKKMK